MNIKPIVGQYAAHENSPQVFMALVLGVDGRPITPASVTSVSYTVWDLAVSRTTAATTETTLTTTDVFFSPPRMTPPWTGPEPGRNFEHQAAGTLFPDATKEHEVEYKIIPTSTVQTFYLKFKGSVHEIRMA
jgi:hypothetical protein